MFFSESTKIKSGDHRLTCPGGGYHEIAHLTGSPAFHQPVKHFLLKGIGLEVEECIGALIRHGFQSALDQCRSQLLPVE